jgi:hypothetical protein
LGLDFGHLVEVLRRHIDPFLIFKLFDLTLLILSKPRLQLEQRYEDTWNIVLLDDLVNDWSR